MRSEIIFVTSLFLMTAPAVAQTPLPNPVKTCEDVRAYIGPDQSMTMDTLKSLLTASGTDPSKSGDQGLDMQCKAADAVGQLILSQRVLGGIRINAHVITDNGVCKLNQISVTGC
jgi:hypothetical protein